MSNARARVVEKLLAALSLSFFNRSPFIIPRFSFSACANCLGGGKRSPRVFLVDLLLFSWF